MTSKPHPELLTPILAPAGRNLLPPIVVDAAPMFDKMLNALALEPVIALDTESDSLYRYFHKVCLVQISTPAADYLVDSLRLRDLAPLGEILARSTIEKVFHAAENDILMLKRDFGFAFARVFDTMLAARILGWPQVGLAALLEQHFGVVLDKRAQLTDWGQRPLSPSQLSYARLDSHYLLELRELLMRELRARGRWREAQEAFSSLPEIQYTEKPFDPEGFWRMKGARDLRPVELAVLRELYLWRNEQSRTLDRPPFKVLGDDALILLSQKQPQRLADLPLRPHQAERWGKAVLGAIARGRTTPPPAQPGRSQNGNGRPDPTVLARFERLRAWRTQRAADRGVDADIVLTNEALMGIARAAPANLEALAALGIMGDWKCEEYGADVLRTLAPDQAGS